LVSKLKEANVKYKRLGAALEFKSGENEAQELTLLCTNNTNHKILYICAYFLGLHGTKVVVIKEGQPLSAILTFLKTTYPTLEEETDPEK
jgi:hypothetical protein